MILIPSRSCNLQLGAKDPEAWGPNHPPHRSGNFWANLTPKFPTVPPDVAAIIPPHFLPFMQKDGGAFKDDTAKNNRAPTYLPKVGQPRPATWHRRGN